MCWQDIEIGEKLVYDKRVLTPPVTSTLLFDHNLSRAAIIFSPPTSGRVSYSTTDLAVAGRGIVMRSTDKPVVLRLAAEGRIVQRRWFMIADAATDVVVVDNWTESAVSAANAAVTATHAAVANQQHRISSIAGGFNAAAAAALVTQINAATVQRYTANNGSVAYPYPIPIVAPVNESVGVNILAGGAAVLGRVSIQGDTIEAVGIATVEVWEGMISHASRANGNTSHRQPVLTG